MEIVPERDMIVSGCHEMGESGAVVLSVRRWAV
jgi:hypothetical protein